MAALVVLASCAGPAPRPPDPALLAAASVAEVSAALGPECRGSGTAIQVGGGRFLTAAHIVDGLLAEIRNCRRAPSPSYALSVAGTPAPATLLRVGQGRIEAPVGIRYLDGADLALLAPARPLPALPAARPCPADPVPGQDLLLVTKRRAERFRVSALAPEPDPRFGLYAELPLAMEPGESGGAAFAASGCLAGLVSHREEEGGTTRTRLVPASAIARFLLP